MDEVHEKNKPLSGYFSENKLVALRYGDRMCSL
jgi:hypothetical protein